MPFVEDWPASQASRVPNYLIPVFAIGVLLAYWPASPERLAGLCLLGGALVAQLLRDVSPGERHPLWSFAYYALAAAATMVLLDPVLGRFGFGARQLMASVARHFGFA